MKFVRLYHIPKPLSQHNQATEILNGVIKNYGQSESRKVVMYSVVHVFALTKMSIEIDFFKSNQQSAIPLFSKTKIPPLNIMYVQSLSSLMHDTINKNAPENLINLFTHVSDIHQYATQSSTSKNLLTKPSRLNIQLNSFSRIGVRLYQVISRSCLKGVLKNTYQVIFSQLLRVKITILMSPNLYRFSQN